MDDLALTAAISGSVAAVGAVVAAIGAWRTEITARWQARAERLRNEEARRENELHRLRHAQLYKWWHDMPSGPERKRAARWFGEWTGARDPYRGDDQGAVPPGFGVRDADEAYERYLQYLDLIFHPGRPGPVPRAIRAPDVRDEQAELPELPAGGWYMGSTALLQPGDSVPVGMTLITDPAAALAGAWKVAAVPLVYQADPEARKILRDIAVTGAIASRALELAKGRAEVSSVRVDSEPSP
jgi:hypothetical protein